LEWNEMNHFSDISGDPISAFADALCDAGFRLSGPPTMDGRYHRCAVDGDKGRERSGCYRGFLDGMPAGSMRNFRDESRSGKWCFKSDGPAHTAEEREAARQAMDASRAQREAVAAVTAAEVAKACRDAWDNAKPAMDMHPYLLRKGISANGLRLHGAQLMAPMRDFDGEGPWCTNRGLWLQRSLGRE
jgi:phage/plasmid primase-like uncharacterized protein